MNTPTDGGPSQAGSSNPYVKIYPANDDFIQKTKDESTLKRKAAAGLRLGSVDATSHVFDGFDMPINTNADACPGGYEPSGPLHFTVNYKLAAETPCEWCGKTTGVSFSGEDMHEIFGYKLGDNFRWAILGRVYECLKSLSADVTRLHTENALLRDELTSLKSQIKPEVINP